MNFVKGQTYQWGQPEEWECDVQRCPASVESLVEEEWSSIAVLSQVIQNNMESLVGEEWSSIAVLSHSEEVSSSSGIPTRSSRPWESQVAPIAYNVEGRSADSGNLGPSQMELEEELKSSARRSSGQWRRGILGSWQGGKHSPWGAILVFVRRSIVQVVTLTFSLYPLFMFWFMTHLHFWWAINQNCSVFISTWSGPDGWNMLCRRERNKLSNWLFGRFCLRKGQGK